MNPIWKAIQFVSDKMRAVGAICLCGMAALTCIDVVGRFFKHPIFGSVELVTFMGVLAVAFALPDTHYQKGHIGVEIIVTRLSATKRLVIDSITQITALVFFSIVSWRMVDYAFKMKASGEVSIELQLPEWLVIFAVAFCFIVFSLIIMKGIVENFRKLRES